ncbi:hypothetical protein BD626DRAFT_483867 [Schizophyllum amplum]|uniref:Uncharacterized protein n=1 Tax=Schizophyllum amplum TaxID=97359 RepID=A0A550CPR7_9AGAR|nr:hypothetical protein BD626DRAFT_483867 [Auriculariopsis ampla]
MRPSLPSVWDEGSAHNLVNPLAFTRTGSEVELQLPSTGKDHRFTDCPFVLKSTLHEYAMPFVRVYRSPLSYFYTGLVWDRLLALHRQASGRTATRGSRSQVFAESHARASLTPIFKSSPSLIVTRLLFDQLRLFPDQDRCSRRGLASPARLVIIDRMQRGGVHSPPRRPRGRYGALFSAAIQAPRRQRARCDSAPRVAKVAMTYRRCLDGI